jgi:hypothetical protein
VKPAFVRRIAFAAVLAGLLSSLPAVSQERVWQFRVFLNDTEVGHHRFALQERGAERELTSVARFNVTLLGISAYRYAHDATERWRGNCVTALSARTNDNGVELAVSAVQQGERLIVSDGRKSEAIEGCAMTFAYWNPGLLAQSRLLNAQTGRYEAVRVTALGEERIVVRGAEVTATRYRILGSKHPIDLWYSARDEWLALESTLENGRRLRYRLA